MPRTPAAPASALRASEPPAHDMPQFHFADPAAFAAIAGRVFSQCRETGVGASPEGILCRFGGVDLLARVFCSPCASPIRGTGARWIAEMRVDGGPISTATVFMFRPPLLLDASELASRVAPHARQACVMVAEHLARTPSFLRRAAALKEAAALKGSIRRAPAGSRPRARL